MASDKAVTAVTELGHASANNLNKESFSLEEPPVRHERTASEYVVTCTLGSHHV